MLLIWIFPDLAKPHWRMHNNSKELKSLSIWSQRPRNKCFQRRQKSGLAMSEDLPKNSTLSYCNCGELNQISRNLSTLYSISFSLNFQLHVSWSSVYHYHRQSFVISCFILYIREKYLMCPMHDSLPICYCTERLWYNVFIELHILLFMNDN